MWTEVLSFLGVWTWQLVRFVVLNWRLTVGGTLGGLAGFNFSFVVRDPNTMTDTLMRSGGIPPVAVNIVLTITGVMLGTALLTLFFPPPPPAQGNG